MVVDPRRDAGPGFCARICALFGAAVVVSSEVILTRQEVENGGVDVALVRLGLRGCVGIEAGTSSMALWPWLPVLFWTGPIESSLELDVARSLGVARVTDALQLLAWLAKAIEPLTVMARARRAALAAERLLPEWPGQVASPSAAPVALCTAEQEFRETYLRALMQRCRSRREAAQVAGLPYTTLVSMMKKLGVPG
jgi:hypothetical protein